MSAVIFRVPEFNLLKQYLMNKKFPMTNESTDAQSHYLMLLNEIKETFPIILQKYVEVKKQDETFNNSLMITFGLVLSVSLPDLALNELKKLSPSDRYFHEYLKAISITYSKLDRIKENIEVLDLAISDNAKIDIAGNILKSKNISIHDSKNICNLLLKLLAVKMKDEDLKMRSIHCSTILKALYPFCKEEKVFLEALNGLSHFERVSVLADIADAEWSKGDRKAALTIYEQVIFEISQVPEEEHNSFQINTFTTAFNDKIMTICEKLLKIEAYYLIDSVTTYLRGKFKKSRLNVILGIACLKKGKISQANEYFKLLIDNKEEKETGVFVEVDTILYLHRIKSLIYIYENLEDDLKKQLLKKISDSKSALEIYSQMLNLELQNKNYEIIKLILSYTSKLIVQSKNHQYSSITIISLLSKYGLYDEALSITELICENEKFWAYCGICENAYKNGEVSILNKYLELVSKFEAIDRHDKILKIFEYSRLISSIEGRSVAEKIVERLFNEIIEIDDEKVKMEELKWFLPPASANNYFDLVTKSLAILKTYYQTREIKETKDFYSYYSSYFYLQENYIVLLGDCIHFMIKDVKLSENERELYNCFSFYQNNYVPDTFELKPVIN